MFNQVVSLRILSAALLIAALAGALGIKPAHAASIVVESNADNTTTDGHCTLREAIKNANANSDTTLGDCAAGSGADKITFHASLSGATITLTSDLPFVNDSLTINGSSLASQVTLDGATTHSAFRLAHGITVTVDSLKISHANAGSLGGGGGISNSGTLTLRNSTLSGNSANNGGGIYNSGTLTVTNSTFSSNDATFDGGAILNNAEMTVSNSTFSDNITASSDGGGVYNGGTLTVTNSTLSGNRASDNDGGGIYNSGALTVTSSTFSSNVAFRKGGAIHSTGGTTTVSNSTFSGNSARDGGGGIYNNGTLTLSNNTFSGNSARDGGGSIYNSGTLTVTNSTFSSNDAFLKGGAMVNSLSGTVTVASSTFSSNDATFDGGGISNSGTLTLRNSTLSGNSANNGGAISSSGSAQVINSTFVGNTAALSGGAIFGSSTMSVTNSTFFANTATSGGGISSGSALTLRNSTLSGNSASGSGGGVAGGTLHYSNTIIANSTSGGDCVVSGGIPTNINNLVEDGGCATGGVNFLSGDPKIGVLFNNGGSTETMDLRSGSPAIDAGDNATCAAAPVSNLDQRGRTRPLDGDGDSVAICDLGAVEKGQPTITTITAHTPDPSTPNQNVALTVTVSGGTTTPTGIVDITGVDTFCGIGLSGGTGSCNTTFTTVGNKRLVATYHGDATHASSGDTETHNVWLMMKFLSQPGKDGWVLESTETGGVGGSLNATATTLRVGDNAQDRQFRSILSFNTADLPDGATITKVQVFVKQSSVTGTNPVDTHGGLRVDIQEPFFGSGLGLALHDFQAGAGLLAGCTIGATPTAAGWYRGNCTATTFFSHINKTGTTQLRLRFNRDDNDDNGADVLNLFSGNAISGNRPYIVVWFLP